MIPDNPSGAAPSRHALLIFTTSAALVGYEIVLMRLISIAQWHHFASMVISIALLGLGASGSLLFLLRHRIKDDPDTSLIILAGATAVSFSLATALSQRVGLDPLNLVWQKGEWLRMGLAYLLMAIPFLFSGGILGIILTEAGGKIPRMYGLDLLGAGCGATAVVPALYAGPPWILLPLLGGLVLLGSLGCCLRRQGPGRAMIIPAVAAALIFISFTALPPIPEIHHTKGLPMTLNLPDARIEARRDGPLGLIHVVASSRIRHVPGLSLRFGLRGGEESIPEQKGIFLDGDGPSPISRFTGDPKESAYLDFTSQSLPYFLRRPERVLVIGPGGGSDVLLALRHNAPGIIATEANRQIAELMTGPFADFSGRLYSRPGVTLRVREARQFLHSFRGPLDLIQISLQDSFGASAGGLHSAAEDYLHTTEAFRLYLSRLSDSGMLSVTTWLKVPPRNSLRLLATALTALRMNGTVREPERHLVLIRSWKTCTLVLSRGPLDREEIGRALRFCEDRNFDLIYYSGMGAEEANRYDVLEGPDYYLGAMALSGPGGPSFIKDYAFDISPTTDDRPYFSHYFRWDRALDLFRQLRSEWLPMMETGYVLLWAALAQSVLAGGVLILLPLLFLRRVHRRSGLSAPAPGRREVTAILCYFASVGLAFMFLEMALLPRFTLLLSHPVYSAAVVLGTLLVFAGLGSLSIQRSRETGPRHLRAAAGFIIAWVVIHVLCGDRLFSWAMAWPLEGRLALAVLMVSLLSFFMGWPFPAGLRVAARECPLLVPWAWGINGCASVTGAVLGKCLAVGMGFRFLMILGCGFYLLAALLFEGLSTGRNRRGP